MPSCLLCLDSGVDPGSCLLRILRILYPSYIYIYGLSYDVQGVKSYDFPLGLLVLSG